MEQKRLYKSRQNRMLCGVCGGIAEYFNIDPTIVRLITVALCLGAGSGLIACQQALAQTPVGGIEPDLAILEFLGGRGERQMQVDRVVLGLGQHLIQHRLHLHHHLRQAGAQAADKAQARLTRQFFLPDALVRRCNGHRFLVG